jgi:hypothetical protein
MPFRLMPSETCSVLPRGRSMEVRERRPWEYLKICAMIVRGASDFDELTSGLHNDAIAELIEERRKEALLMIERMRTQ